MYGNRDVVSDRAVGSVFVVVSAPSLQLFAGICKAHEPIGVQALRAQLDVERFDEAVVCRLSWPGEIQDDRIGISPEIEVARDELAAIINPDRLRIADLIADLFQRLDDVLPAIAEPCIASGTKA